MALHDDQRVLFAIALLRLGQTLPITPAVLELEHIDRPEIGADLAAWFGIEKYIEAPARTDAHMVITLGANIEVALDLGTIKKKRIIVV